ncbi:dense granule protein DG32 [Toxoplasma gondii TgCatPRC2]|uniref:Dense granule protein DG32 n=1 Tax=Toxoplasma gondii TgCatPRC2 TaxID=1130821 RepID=A0A151H1U4_TOXGO|nr:dense granule protein DG32 [Toxoplasma gondii TgCatPRC2]
MAARAGSSGVSRRFLFVLFTVLAGSSFVSADDAFIDNVKKGVGEHIGGTPVDLVLNDLYPLIVKQGLGGMLGKIMYKVKGIMYYRLADGVADVVMSELEFYLFGEKGANQSSFKELRKLYETYMRKFFAESPEDPVDALTTGVWKGLLQLFTEKLQDAFRGSPKGQKMADLLFDSNLTLIKSWTDAAHLQIMQLSSSSARANALRLLRAKQKKPLARKN